MELIPGTIVIISNLSKASYYLYRSYTHYSSYLICPCHLKRDQMLIVEEVIGNIVLLKAKNSNVLTMTYISDLQRVYE